MGTTPIAWNIPKTDTSTLNVNLGGYKPSVGSEIAGSLASIGTMLLMGAINNGVQNQGNRQGNPGGTEAQQGSSQALQLARSMTAEQLNSELKNTKTEIENTQTELQTAAEEARGKDSDEYKATATAAQALEAKYGFGSGDVSKGDTTQKSGRDYQNAATAYNTLQTKLSKYTTEDTRISTALQTNTKSTEDVNAKLKALKEVPDPGDGKGVDAKDYQTKLIQYQNYKNQETSLNNQKKELEAQKTKLDQDKVNNEKNKVEQKDVDAAKKTMDDLAKAKGGADNAEKYKEYQSLVDKCKQIEINAGPAKAKVASLDAKVKLLEKTQLLYQEAAQMKDKMTKDDNDSSKSYKGASSHDGNFFSRLFNKAERNFKKVSDNDIQTYMQDHGVSRKEAKKALEALSETQGDQKPKEQKPATDNVTNNTPVSNTNNIWGLPSFTNPNISDAKNKANSFLSKNPGPYDIVKITDFYKNDPNATEVQVKTYLGINT